MFSSAAESRQLFLDFLDATAMVLIDQRKIVVRFQTQAGSLYLEKTGKMPVLPESPMNNLG